MIEEFKKLSDEYKESGWGHGREFNAKYNAFLISQYTMFNNPLELYHYCINLGHYVWYRFVDITVYPVFAVSVMGNTYNTPPNPTEEQSGLHIAQLFDDFGTDLREGRIYKGMSYLDEIYTEINKVMRGEVIIKDAVLRNAIILLSRTNMYTMKMVADAFHSMPDLVENMYDMPHGWQKLTTGLSYIDNYFDE